MTQILILKKQFKILLFSDCLYKLWPYYDSFEHQRLFISKTKKLKYHKNWLNCCVSDLGCCWDVTKERHCFYAEADARIPADDTSKEPNPGRAAALTAMSFIIIYAVAGVGYYFKYVK